LVGNLEGKKPLGNLNVSEKLIKEIIQENMMLGFGFDFNGERWGPVSDCCEHGNEPSVTIIVDNICQVLHNVYGPWT
jgi:hypothetical protein